MPAEGLDPGVAEKPRPRASSDGPISAQHTLKSEVPNHHLRVDGQMVEIGAMPPPLAHDS